MMAAAFAGPPPPVKGDAQAQGAYLKAWIKPYAEHCATEVVFCGEPERMALAIVTNAVANHVSQHGLIANLVGPISQTALADALSRCRVATEKIRWAVLPLIRERRPGQEIIAAARRTNDRSDFGIPTPLIIEFVRSIAHAQPQKRSIGR